MASSTITTCHSVKLTVVVYQHQCQVQPRTFSPSNAIIFTTQWFTLVNCSFFFHTLLNLGNNLLVIHHVKDSFCYIGRWGWNLKFISCSKDGEIFSGLWSWSCTSNKKKLDLINVYTGSVFYYKDNSEFRKEKQRVVSRQMETSLLHSFW